MSDILASVSVVLGAEISGFRAAMADARKELRGLVQFSEGLKDIGTSLTTYVSAPLALLGAGAVAASAKMESLSKGLQAIAQADLAKSSATGFVSLQQAADVTGERLKVLQDIAKAPGIGFEQAVQGDIRLRAVGISAQQSAAILKEFANAIALTGGGAAELNQVTVQLGQMAAKGKVLSQDLRPILEAAPAAAAALKKLFGTVDSEEISKQLQKAGQSSSDFIALLTDELAKAPRVTGGLANSFENLSQTATQSLAKIGDAISKSLDLPGLTESLSNGIEGLAATFEGLSPATQSFLVGLGGLAVATGPVLVGIGTLGAALPALKAGFAVLGTATTAAGESLALLAGPVGLAVAGLAALAAGLYYVSTAADRSLSAYQGQAKETDALTASITPLLDRYNELSAKTTLTAAEQTELASVIKQLAAAVPGATTAIDAYGTATAISGRAVTEFTQALQAQKAAQAALNLPAASQKLDELATKYRVLKAQADEFNRTGSIQVATYDEGGGSLEHYKAGSQAVLELQANLASANVEYLKQQQLVDALKGSVGGLSSTLRTDLSPALTETQLALKFLGGQGQEATGLLAGLHEQLKQLKQEQQDAPTAALALAYVPLIKNLQDTISKLEGTSKEGKKATDALTKLRQELARLTALDNFLGDTPNQMQVLERRAGTLATGLKSLVDAGVSTSSKAFKDFAVQLASTSQAFDKLQISSALDLKPVDVKSLIPQTIGDTLPADVARLLGDYAKQVKPFELPVPVKLNMQAILGSAQEFKTTFEDGFLSVIKGVDTKGLGKPLVDYGNALKQISGDAEQFGGSFAASLRGLDVAGEKANAARAYLIALREAGFSPLSAAVQGATADLRQYNTESQNITAISESLKEGVLTLSSALGDAISKVAFAGAGVGDFFKTVFAGIIDALADFAEKKGKILIADGIADLATPGFQAIGAAKLAGGIGLLVAAGVGHAGATELRSSASSGGVGGINTSVPSSPKTYSPNQQAATPAPVTITHEVVMVQRGSDLRGVLQIATTRNGRVLGSGG